MYQFISLSFKEDLPTLRGRGHLNTYPTTLPTENKVFLNRQGFLNSLEYLNGIKSSFEVPRDLHFLSMAKC